jgi:putative serine/threonine protein kinase
MQKSQTVSLRQLRDKKYAVVLCYPRYDLEETTKRITELKHLGVKALEFSGEKTVFNVPVLGKGFVGIVVSARICGARVALKIRRVDADRSGMQREAEMLKVANKAGVGPKLIGVSANFLAMEFIEGVFLPKWLENLRGKGRGTTKRIKYVLRDVLEQCWLLDKAGLDHGELSHASKHIIVRKDDKPCIVDFETASTARRKSNVTSICQYFFVGSQLALSLGRKLGRINEQALIMALRCYKNQNTRINFEHILRVCGLV